MYILCVPRYFNGFVCPIRAPQGKSINRKSTLEIQASQSICVPKKRVAVNFHFLQKIYLFSIKSFRLVKRCAKYRTRPSSSSSSTQRGKQRGDYAAALVFLVYGLFQPQFLSLLNNGATVVTLRAVLEWKYTKLFLCYNLERRKMKVFFSLFFSG